jgi:hypothetical protein
MAINQEALAGLKAAEAMQQLNCPATPQTRTGARSSARSMTGTSNASSIVDNIGNLQQPRGFGGHFGRHLPSIVLPHTCAGAKEFLAYDNTAYRKLKDLTVLG